MLEQIPAPPAPTNDVQYIIYAILSVFVILTIARLVEAKFKKPSEPEPAAKCAVHGKQIEETATQLKAHSEEVWREINDMKKYMTDQVIASTNANLAFYKELQVHLQTREDRLEKKLSEFKQDIIQAMR